MPETCMPQIFGHDQAVCPVSCPVPCPPDHMWCDGGVDAIGCVMPNTCVPHTGPEEHCAATCPIVCPPDHIVCPGGIDGAGCQMPDTCMPMIFGEDGAVCPAICPVVCDYTVDKHCPGGVDANGCPMPDTCMLMTEDCPAVVAPPAPCENNWTDKKCKKKKKCGKPWVRNNCQKTCGQC